jgi:hypothetical protein
MDEKKREDEQANELLQRPDDAVEDLELQEGDAEQVVGGDQKQQTERWKIMSDLNP